MERIVCLIGIILILACGAVQADPLAYEDSAFGVFAAYAQEYDYFKQHMGFSDQGYWDWADSLVRNLGAHWTRSNLQLFWDFIEPVIGGGYNWNNTFKTDGVVTNVYRPGGDINWLGVFHEGGSNPGHTPARNPLDYPTEYSRFVRDAVERYDCDGVYDASLYV